MGNSSRKNVLTHAYISNLTPMPSARHSPSDIPMPTPITFLTLIPMPHPYGRSPCPIPRPHPQAPCPTPMRHPLCPTPCSIPIPMPYPHPQAPSPSPCPIAMPHYVFKYFRKREIKSEEIYCS